MYVLKMFQFPKTKHKLPSVEVKGGKIRCYGYQLNFHQAIYTFITDIHKLYKSNNLSKITSH